MLQCLVYIWAVKIKNSHHYYAEVKFAVHFLTLKMDVEILNFRYEPRDYILLVTLSSNM